MIEMYLLEQLKAFRDFGTLSAAAEELHLAQPTLSRSMQKLEDILGVPLFGRGKNKMTMNETGKLAAEYASRILDSEAEMERHIRAFDRSLHTITVGSCAPGPLYPFLPLITSIFSGMTISSEIVPEDKLLPGLDSDLYQIVLLPHSVDDSGHVSHKYITEQLYMSVNIMQPTASYKAITFHEMDGQNFIMYSQVGMWENIVREAMPHAKFFKQEDLEALGEIAGSSTLPMFASSITVNEFPSRLQDRINIPITDPEATIDFYLVCRKRDAKRFSSVFETAGE